MDKTGVRDILISNEIVDKQKIKRLVNLRKSNGLKGIIYNYKNAKNISSASREKRIRVGILIDLNIDMYRFSPDK